MRVVRRIERAAEQADAHAGRVRGGHERHVTGEAVDRMLTSRRSTAAIESRP